MRVSERECERDTEAPGQLGWGVQTSRVPEAWFQSTDQTGPLSEGCSIAACGMLRCAKGLPEPQPPFTCSLWSGFWCKWAQPTFLPPTLFHRLDEAPNSLFPKPTSFSSSPPRKLPSPSPHSQPLTLIPEAQIKCHPFHEAFSDLPSSPNSTCPLGCRRLSHPKLVWTPITAPITFLLYHLTPSACVPHSSPGDKPWADLHHSTCHGGPGLTSLMGLSPWASPS